MGAPFHALTLLREHRGDGHVAALIGVELGGIDALVTHTATGKGFTQPAAQTTRAWSDDEWAAAVAGLAERGLMTVDGELTDDGLALRKASHAGCGSIPCTPGTSPARSTAPRPTGSRRGHARPLRLAQFQWTARTPCAPASRLRRPG